MPTRLVFSTLLALVLAAKPGWGDKLPPSNSCTAHVSLGRVDLSWIAVPGAESYAISRDGVFLGTAPPTYPTVWVDYPPPGTHTYCIVAQAAGYEPSDPCCMNTATAYPPSGQLTCSASTDLVRRILVQWNDLDGETGYVVTKDGYVVFQGGAGLTSFLDDGVLGYANYCVHAVNAFGSSNTSCATGYGAEGRDGTWRLSWGTCSPQVSNQNFAGPGPYQLVLSVAGASQTSVGHESEIHIRPAVPDAWRFDNAGCQTASGFTVFRTGLLSCPPMSGKNPLTISFYKLSDTGDGSAVLHLAETYDPFVPDPTKRYVLWRIFFNHQYSIAGQDSDPETCDGAGQTLGFKAVPAFLLTTNQWWAAAHDPQDMPVTWNGDAPVRTIPLTWGKVKSLYR